MLSFYTHIYSRIVVVVVVGLVVGYSRTMGIELQLVLLVIHAVIGGSFNMR